MSGTRFGGPPSIVFYLNPFLKNFSPCILIRVDSRRFCLILAIGGRPLMSGTRFGGPPSIVFYLNPFLKNFTMHSYSCRFSPILSYSGN